MPILTALFALVAAPTAQASAIEVPFRLGEDALIVDATVNGRKVPLMFDTGFSGAVILDPNINVGKPTGSMTLRDFVGQFQAKTVKIRSLSLGKMKIDVKEMPDVVQHGQSQDMSFGYGTHVDGIMGFSVIKDYVTEINFEKKKFIFHPKGTDITKRKPDNKRTFLAKLLPIGGDSLEMEVRTAGGKKMILALDTGNAFYATTHKEVLEKVGLWPEGKQAKFIKLAGVASGAVESWYMRMPDLTIYGVPVKSSVWSIIDLPKSDAVHDGTVGFGFLKHFNITIDYSRRRIWLENFSGKVADEPQGDIGLTAFPDFKTKRVRIVRVSPGSPADVAGIKADDEILSVDGIDLNGIGFRRLEKMLQGAQGTKVKLAVSRAGNLMRYELERAYLHNE